MYQWERFIQVFLKRLNAFVAKTNLIIFIVRISSCFDIEVVQRSQKGERQWHVRLIILRSRASVIFMCDFHENKSERKGHEYREEKLANFDLINLQIFKTNSKMFPCFLLFAFKSSYHWRLIACWLHNSTFKHFLNERYFSHPAVSTMSLFGFFYCCFLMFPSSLPITIQNVR